MRLLFRRRRRCGRPLLLPLIELLLLLLFLLRGPLLYRWRRPYQRMRFRHSSRPLLLLLRTETLIVRCAICRGWLISVFSRRIFRLLERLRLRVRHLADLRIARVRIRVRRCERMESRFSRCRPRALIRSRSSLICRGGRTSRTRWPHQRLLVEMSSGLRLPLVDGPRRRRRRSHGDDWTADHGRRRPR